MNQTSLDIIDLLEKSEQLFRITFQKKNQVLKLVKQESNIGLPEAANDDIFENPFIDALEKIEPGYERQQFIADRVESIEPGYYEYLHTIYVERLHFVESIFTQVITFLSESNKNHIWAIDPHSHAFHIPEHIPVSYTHLTLPTICSV